MMDRSLCLAQEPDADALLSRDPLALLLGMLLDQQIPMERAFAGPYLLAQRVGAFDAAAIAAMNPEELAAAMVGPPAVHRFPGSMARRVQTLCEYVVDHYEGDIQVLWTAGQPDGQEALRRLKALPGFGDQKARIFLALLGKQWGVELAGWREAAGTYGDPDARRSVADVVDQETLEQVRSWKKQQKAAAKNSLGT